MTVPFSVITSVEEFQAVFTPPPPSSSSGGGSPSAATPRDAFLLCYEVPADGVTAESLQAFRAAVNASAAQHQTALSLHLWDCTSEAFAAAKDQLGKRKGEPLMLVVHHGAIADMVRGSSLATMLCEDVPRVCERLSAFQRSRKPLQVVASSPPSAAGAAHESTAADEPRTLRVDVARIMNLGRDLLSKGEPAYAEKAFVKALDALKAVEPEVRASSNRDGLEDYEGSVAMALAWAGLSQMVLGKATQSNAYLRQLTQEERFARFCEEPLTDACRAVTTQRLMAAAPRTWTGETCSQRRLGEALARDPMDHSSRSMLVITLFLAGDLERALTEAVKLSCLEQDFGRVALKRIKDFLGPEHALVRQLGPLTAV